jgi:hypothetical protein
MRSRTGTGQHSAAAGFDGAADLQERPDRRLPLVTAGAFAVVVAFQVALVAGAPWGAAAYGGADRGHLPGELRVASGVQALFWLFAALTALARGGLPSPIPYAFSRRAMWVLTTLLVVGTILNAASSSPWERYGWAPFILALAALSLRLARTKEDPVRDRTSDRSRPA